MHKKCKQSPNKNCFITLCYKNKIAQTLTSRTFKQTFELLDHKEGSNKIKSGTLQTDTSYLQL